VFSVLVVELSSTLDAIGVESTGTIGAVSAIGSLGTVVWTSAVFLGHFVCPLVVLALSGALDGLGAALVVLGAGSLAAAAGVRPRGVSGGCAAGRRTRR
jgi:hypothetical protein